MTESPRRSAVIRRVHLPDSQAMHDFVLRLSSASRRSRFHGAVNDISPSLLRRLVSADGKRNAAWVACVWGEHGEEIVGEAVWYVAGADHNEAEFAISVRDDWQGRGVADELMHMLVTAARESGLRQLYGDVLQSNARMLAFMRRHGMEAVYCEPEPEPGVTRLGRMFDAPAAQSNTRKGTRRSWLTRVKSLWT
jgi:acetyltransferase